MNRQVEKHDSTQPHKPIPAPRGPGSKPRWTSSAKTGVGTAITVASRIWYTIGQGVLNEIYFPDVDKANTRTIRFLVTDGEDFFSDEEHDCDHTTAAFEAGAPGYRVVSVCRQGRYRITKEIVAESVRDTLLIQVQFETLGDVAAATPLKLYLYIEPHLGDRGAGNSCWIGEYQGQQMLFAGRASSALAAYSDASFRQASCGFVGRNDGYADLKANCKTDTRVQPGERGQCRALR